MSLRHDSSRNVKRAARRNNAALERACESVLKSDALPWETLETRVLMSLVHHYPFNENAGTTTADLGSVPRPGTLITDTSTAAGDHGAPGLAAGPNDAGVSWQTANPSPAGGSYLRFNGALNNGGTFNNTGGRVDVSPNNTIAESLHNELGLSASVAAWIRITDSTPSEYVGNDTIWQAPAITGNEQAADGNDIFFGSITADGSVAMQKGDSAQARSLTSLRDGTWHHVVVTRDWDTGQARTYVDGRLHSTATTHAGPVSAFWDSIGALTDVANNGTGIDGYNYMNNTDLDDVKMYNHVLNLTEVQALLPGAASGPLASAPAITSVVADASNFRNATISFTDANANELGFIIERAMLSGTGEPGAFTQVGQVGAGSGGSFTDTRIDQANRSYVYRVRAFNSTNESANALSNVITAGSAGMPASGLTAGWLNSNFWGATARQWPADPNLDDGATPGNGAENVGSIRLFPDPTVAYDPANPSGLAVRDPDVRAIDPLTQSTMTDPDSGQTGVGRFRLDWGTGSPNGAIRADNFSTIYSGKLTFTVPEVDLLPGNGPVQLQFNGWSDDDGHYYVNGQLASTDPGGHGARDTANRAVFTVTEGQTYSWDIMGLQAEQGGGAATGLKWGYAPAGNTDPGIAAVSLRAFDFIPATRLSPLPSVPAAARLAQVGTATSHQVSFNITEAEASTSEQRFELWRRPTSADTTGAGFTKVNEAGINATYINDASARPGQTYDYIVVGYNHASGFTPIADAMARKVTVTTAAEPAAVQGLNGYYFNDDFWGQGERAGTTAANTWPLARLGQLYAGSVGPTLTPIGADVHEMGVMPANWGDNNHDPSVRPGGTPHAQIRDESHSTVWTGKITFPEAGTYQVLGFGDDDTHVFIDNVLVSSDPFGHGPRDPRPNVNDQTLGNTADRFTNPFVVATAGETHDIVVLQSEQGGGSALELRWVRPGQPSATTELIPATAFSTATTAPTAAGTPTVSGQTGDSALITASAVNPTNELRNVVVLATDAAFTQNVRTFPVGILVDTGAPNTGTPPVSNNPRALRVTGLTPNTQYFYKIVSSNFEGSTDSATTVPGTPESFNSGGQAAPAVPTNLRARPQTAGQNLITWTDASNNETAFVLQRRTAGGTFATVATLPAGSTSYVDVLDATTPAGTVLEYQIMSTNAGGNSAASAVSAATVGGGANANGTGLRRRVWTATNETANPDNLYNGTYGPVGEPARDTSGAAQAPAADDVDAIIPNTFGNGAPAHSVRDQNNFATEWVGEIMAEETKAYIFSHITDDGGRLYINDVLVTDGAYRYQGATEYSTEPINLTAGQKIRVRFQHFEGGGDAAARLRWNGAGNVREDIPAVFMFPTVTANDEVAQVPQRPVTDGNVFSLPSQLHSWSFAPAPVIGVRWQDNAFGEAGYEIQRATNAAFTAGFKTVSLSDDLFAANRQLVGPGRDLFIDDGGYNGETFVATPLDPNTEYFYRVRPLGAADTAWVTVGSTKANRFEAGRDYTIPNFPTQQRVTTNGSATTTPEGTLRITNNQNNEGGQAYINGAFDVNTDFKVNFDFQISNSNGADGMAFVIQNVTQTTPARPANSGLSSPLRATGTGGGLGGAMGYVGMQNTIAFVFDTYDNIDNFGLIVNGSDPGNTVGTQVNDTSAGPLFPGTGAAGMINLRDAANGAIDLNNGTIYDFSASYNNATDVMTIEIRRADADPASAPLFRTQYSVDIAGTLLADEAVMGWTGGTGGLNQDQEIHNFKYDGPNAPDRGPTDDAVVSQVYVRGTSWLLPANVTFAQWLEANGHGDDVLGYRVDQLAAATTTADTTIPWTNVNQIVVRYAQPVTGGIPLPGSYTVNGTHGAYTVTAVEQVGTDGTTFALTLNRALGVLPDLSGTDGDRVQLQVSGGGVGTAPFNLLMNSLQGDSDRRNGRVNANDVGTIRSRQNRTAAEVPPTGLAPYTAFADLDTNGRINANDVGSVRSRQNDVLPAAPAPAGDVFGSTAITEEVLSA